MDCGNGPEGGVGGGIPASLASRAASQSAEDGYCGKQHKRGVGRSGVK